MNVDALRVVAKQGLQARGLKIFWSETVVRNIFGIRRGEAVGLLTRIVLEKPYFICLPGLFLVMKALLGQYGCNDTPLFQRARMGVGYLPQESSIFRGLSVEKNIRSVLEITERNPDTRDAMLEELLAEFSIGHLRNTPSVNLSGGERRRLEIARALAARPAFLLLDEPLAGIDPIALADIRDLIAQLKEHGLGVLITDHNVREMLGIIERAYIIRRRSFNGGTRKVVGLLVYEVYLGERFSI